MNKELTKAFENINEADGYYIAAIAWELIDDDSIKSVNVILKHSEKEMKNLLYKYSNGRLVLNNIPLGMSTDSFLREIRQDIYDLRNIGQHKKAVEYFRKVFMKDPYTGEDIKSEQ